MSRRPRRSSAVVLFGLASTHSGSTPPAALAHRFLAVASRFAAGVAGRSPVAYNTGRIPLSYEVAHLPANHVAALAGILALVEQPLELELFDPTSPAARTLRLYVVGIRKPDGSWVHFLRAKGETLRLRRTSKIAAVMTGAAYDELDEDPLIFDSGFDAIVANGVALVVNQTAFERTFGFVEQARILATQTVELLAPQLAITNWDEFAAAATSDLNTISKIRSISEKMRSPAYAAAMTTERLLEFATANNIDVDTQEVDGQHQLVFHREPARRYRILKLLDDDYLHSQLTQLDYEVNSTSPLAHS